MTKVRPILKAYTIVELMIAISIFALIAAAGLVSFGSLSSKKALQAEAENIKQDMYLMQSRAVTGLKNQRFVIVTNSSYKLEEDVTGTGNWATFQQARALKNGVYFYGYSGKENKLEYHPNGLPEFNGESANPFFSVIYQTVAEKKDINIDSSGIVSIDE
jgi:prepilin-type N-terminal cleavage/methylation domain-containing protein